MKTLLRFFVPLLLLSLLCGTGSAQTTSGIKAYATTSATYATWNQYPIPWDTVAWGTSSMFDSSHPTRLVAPSAGYYLAVCFVSSKVSATGNQYINVSVNGGFALFSSQTTGSYGNLTTSGVVKMAAGDYMECWFGNYTGSTISFYDGSIGEYGASGQLVKLADTYN